LLEGFFFAVFAGFAFDRLDAYGAGRSSHLKMRSPR
jgi:hypothetical protein